MVYPTREVSLSFSANRNVQRANILSLHSSQNIQRNDRVWHLGWQFLTNHCILPRQTSKWELCSRKRSATLGTRGRFSRVRRKFSVLPKADKSSAVGRSHERRSSEKNLWHYKDLTETRNRARKLCGTQGKEVAKCLKIHHSFLAKCPSS